MVPSLRLHACYTEFCNNNYKQAYDGHMNLILSDVEETILLVDANEAAPPSGRINVSAFSISYIASRSLPYLTRWSMLSRSSRTFYFTGGQA